MVGGEAARHLVTLAVLLLSGLQGMTGQAGLYDCRCSGFFSLIFHDHPKHLQHTHPYRS